MLVSGKRKWRHGLVLRQHSKVFSSLYNGEGGVGWGVGMNFFKSSNFISIMVGPNFVTDMSCLRVQIRKLKWYRLTMSLQSPIIGCQVGNMKVHEGDTIQIISVQYILPSLSTLITLFVTLWSAFTPSDKRRHVRILLPSQKRWPTTTSFWMWGNFTTNIFHFHFHSSSFLFFFFYSKRLSNKKSDLKVSSNWLFESRGRKYFYL